MKKTFSYETFIDFSNEKVKSLEDDIDALIIEKNKKIEEIEEIQSKCEHEYFMTSIGHYQDNYKCIHCGHETEK